MGTLQLTFALPLESSALRNSTRNSEAEELSYEDDEPVTRKLFLLTFSVGTQAVTAHRDALRVLRDAGIKRAKEVLDCGDDLLSSVSCVCVRVCVRVYVFVGGMMMMMMMNASEQHTSLKYRSRMRKVLVHAKMDNSGRVEFKWTNIF